MKNKTGQLSWGLFLITLGSLFFLTKYHIVTYDWDMVWDFWPVVLVLWGISVIVKNTEFKPIVSMIFGIVMGVLVYGSFFYVFNDYDDDIDSESNYVMNTYSEEFDSNFTHASLNVLSGAGKFTINRTTSNLVKAIAKGDQADYRFYTNGSDSTVDVTIKYDKNRIGFIQSDITNMLDIKLNDYPVWDMNFKIGAAKNKFDLSNYKVKSVKLETGATNTFIKLGDLYNRTKVHVQMGAAALEIHVPKESGCKISGEMVFSAKDLTGFEKLGDDYYKTPNFNDAENQVEIFIEAGVSSIKVKRY